MIGTDVKSQNILENIGQSKRLV